MDQFGEMTFAEFCESYEHDKGPRLKESTWKFKNTIINSKLVPYFGEMKLESITPQDVMRWQNYMMSMKDGKGRFYSANYLRDVHAQLSAIFNHAVRYYGLERNPASVVGTFDKGAPSEMLYWTKEEYSRFAEQVRGDRSYYCAFEMLYWTGMREGELLALTAGDVDTAARTVTINKTYHRIDAKDVITSPKTAKSNRTVSLPGFLCEEMEEYMQGMGKDDRLFLMSSYHLRTALAQGADRAGVKRIRVHDLRHSHVSLLINNGFSALAIGERVGHEAEKITYRYAHLFNSVQNQMVDLLESVHEK